MASFNLNQLFKGAVSKYMEVRSGREVHSGGTQDILRCWGLRLECMNVGVHNLAYNIAFL